MKDLIVIDEDVKLSVDNMTVVELREMAQLAKELEGATGTEIVQIMTAVANLKNDGHGKSNKVVCAENDVNHRTVIEVMKGFEWLDENNELTEAGFRVTNNAVGMVNINMETDTLVLQNYGGGLYWNTANDNFERIWKMVYEEASHTTYNRILKDTEKPLSKQTLKLLKEMGMYIYNK